MYYSIGELAEMLSVNLSTLRYWETEFSIIKPRKNGKGDRFYSPEDVKNIKLIHHLLKERKLTIKGAQEILKANKGESFTRQEIIEKLTGIKEALLSIKKELDNNIEVDHES